jgi:hypothetical protein
MLSPVCIWEGLVYTTKYIKHMKKITNGFILEEATTVPVNGKQTFQGLSGGQARSGAKTQESF